MWAKIKAKLAGCVHSLTIWFNGVMASLLVAMPFLQDNIPQLETYLEGQVYKFLMGFVVVANMLLRFKTSKPLEAKTTPPAPTPTP